MDQSALAPSRASPQTGKRSGSTWVVLLSASLLLWVVALLALPMVLDGITHMMSDFAGIGEGFRYTNEWLAQLTQYRLPQSFYVGTTIRSFNSWMRLITGVLFGVGVGWFVFPNLGVAFTRPKHKLTDRRLFPNPNCEKRNTHSSDTGRRSAGWSQTWYTLLNLRDHKPNLR